MRAPVFVPVLALALLVAPPVRADLSGWGISEATLQQLAMDATTAVLLEEVARGALRGGRAARAARRPVQGASVQAPPAKTGPRVPRALAAAYPAARRAQAEQMFTAMLDGYHKLESKLGIAKYDLAGAMATFVVSNYQIWNDVDLPDAHFPPLVAQLREALAKSTELARASAEARQDLYERLAILGVYMAATKVALARRPDRDTEAALKRTAKVALEQMLKVDAGRVVIGAGGLSIAQGKRVR